MHRTTADGPLSTRRTLSLPALVLVLAAAFGCAQPAVEPAPETVYPGASWERLADPAAAGFSAEALDAIHPYVDGINTTAVMAVVGGRVLFEHGPVDEISYLASVRKSILAMLYGRYVEDGTIDLELTVADLGMDDVQGLMPIEKRARVLDLVTARSGVYHPASNSGDNLADAPAPRLAGTRHLPPVQQLGLQRGGRGLRTTDRAQHLRRARNRPRNPARIRGLAPVDPPQVGRRDPVAQPRVPHEPLDPRHGPDRISDAPRRCLEGGARASRGMGRANFGSGHALRGDESGEPARRRVRLRVHVVGVGRPGGAGGVPRRLHRTRSLGPVHHRHPSLDMVVAHKTVPQVATPWDDYRGILDRLVAAHCGADC